jgi:hypothetical protein
MDKQVKPSQNNGNDEPQYRNQIPDFKYTPDPPRESDSDSENESDD